MALTAMLIITSTGTLPTSSVSAPQPVLSPQETQQSSNPPN